MLKKYWHLSESDMRHNLEVIKSLTHFTASAINWPVIKTQWSVGPLFTDWVHSDSLVIKCEKVVSSMCIRPKCTTGMTGKEIDP